MSQDVQQDMRQEIVALVARQLGAIISKRVSLAVNLWGEPGIGKTHAARAILERVPCHHLSLHATTPAAQIAPALPRVKALPRWAQTQLEQLERGEHVEADALAQMLVAALEKLAPFVLHLEDAHETDEERGRLIQSLARAIARTRGVGLLVTSRTALVTPFLNHRLEPLSLMETAELLSGELRTDAPQNALNWVFARTRGNPLFALEYLRYLRRQGFLWSDGERWHWREPPSAFVPVSVEALILDLVSNTARTPEARSVLEARAILPDAFDPARLQTVWQQVAGLKSEAFEGVRGPLEQNGVLNDQGFAHPLFAEVISHDLEGERRAVYAARAARALETIDPGLAAEYADSAGLDPEETIHRLEGAAHRLSEAGDGRRAARLLVRAADRASGERQAALALNAARRLRGIDIPEWERMARLAMTSAVHRREATFLCVTAMQGDGRHDEAWRLLESLPEADKTGLEWWQMHLQFYASMGRNLDAVRVWDEQPELQGGASAWTRYRIISCLIRLNQTERAAAMIETALAEPALNPRERARLLDRRNYIDYREARYEAVERTLTEVIESMDETVFPADFAAYYGNRANARTRLGKHLEAKQDAERAHKLSLSIGSAAYNVGFATALALTQIYLREYPQAEQVLLEAISLSQDHGHERLWDCYGHLSFLYQRWNPPYGPMLARRYAQLALAEARSLDRPDALESALEDCVRAELICDAPEAAMRYARELESLAEHTGRDQDRMASTALMGRSLAALGDGQAALVYLRRAADLYESHGQHGESLSHELEIDRLEGNLEAARQKLAWFEANHDAHHVARVLRYFPQLGRSPEPGVEEARSGSRINVLGPIILERDHQGVPTRARKRLEILAYLLETRVGGRSEASVLDLVDAVYPSEPEPEAKNALKQQVYLIRSSLGAESVLSTSGGYALGNVTSDAEDFLRSGDPRLWRGPYLSSLEDGWLPSVREALTLGLRSKVTALISTDASEAARLGLILCEMEPFDADALRLTVRALEAAGETVEAHRTFLKGRARLQEVGEALPEALDRFVTAS